MFRRISLLCIPCLLFAFLLQSPDFSYYPERAQKFISIRTRLDEEESIEKKITAPLEEELLRVKGVAEISSLSGRGESRITLLLDEDQNLDDAYLEVRERVQRVSAHYPDTAGTPMLLKSQSSSSPVFVLAIPPETDISADRLKSLFQSVRGTGEIEISSASNPEVHIECSPGLLSSLKLSSADLGIRIAENNALSAVHRDTGILLMDQRIKSLVDFGSIPVNNGFLLADAGQITLTGAEQRSISELNGAPGQVMWISKTGSANVIRLCRKLRAKTADLEGSRVLYDRGALIEEALSGLFLTLGLSCASVFLVTAIFIRKFRELLLLCLNIPFSLAGTMALLTLAGQDINLSVLAGLALCSGMIIDSGVIVLEQGLKPALKPLTASLVSTILVLSPLIFASPSLKILCLPLAAAVSICLTLSFLYILIILGGSGRMSRDLYKSSFRLPTAGRGLEALPMIILLLTFPAFLSLGRLRYREEIDLADRTLGFSVEFEAGRTKERVREGLKRVDAFLRASDVPEYYSSSYSDERGRFLIKLGKESDREKIRRQIIAEAGIIRGYLSFDDSPAEESYLIRIKGEDRNELKRVSDDLARYLESQSGEYQVVLGYKEQPDTLLITTDNLKCSAAGISPERIAGYLLLAQNPPVLGKWLPPGVGELRDIRITGSKAGPEGLEALLIPSEGQYRLKDLASITDTTGRGPVTRHNGRRALTIYLKGFDKKPGEIYSMVEDFLESFSTTEGIQISHGEHYRARQRVIRELALLSGGAMVLLYLMLVFFFENLKLPLLVLAGIILTELFTLTALSAAGIVLSIPLFFALILNAGLGVNSYLLVLNPYMGRIPSRKEAFSSLLSCRISLISASATTLAGLLPFLVFGGNSITLFRDLSITLGLGILISLILLTASLSLLPQDSSIKAMG